MSSGLGNFPTHVSVDRTKILEAAQKHLAKGAYDKAIVEFQKLVRADPTDVRTWLKIGDLFARKGSTKEAVDTYVKVADQYASQGFFLKAVAVQKQVLKLDASRLDVHLRLGEMYEQLQLVSDALATYETVAGGYARAGNIDKALATLGRMAELDAENIPVRIKYAEALSKANRPEDAAREFAEGAKLLKAQGRMDDYIKVVERLLYHRPEDAAVARELSQLYLARNDAKRALAKLQICFKADPKDVETLEMLAEAFHQLQQLPKTISVLREVARIHGEAGRDEARAKTLKRILELDPGDPEARQGLAGYAVQPAPEVRRDIAPPPGAVVARDSFAERPSIEVQEVEESWTEEELEEFEQQGEIQEVIYEADDDDAVIMVDDAIIEVPIEEGFIEELDVDAISLMPASLAPDVASDPPAESASVRTSLPPEVAREAQIAKLLTEVDVFLRYGLKDKVVAQLLKVLELDPEHVEARERLKDVFVERGDVAAAVSELITLADIFAAERPPVALLYLRQAEELAPADPIVQQRLRSMGADPNEAQARDPMAFEDRTIFEPPPEEASEEPVFFMDDADAEGEAEEPSTLERTPVPGRLSDQDADLHARLGVPDDLEALPMIDPAALQGAPQDAPRHGLGARHAAPPPPMDDGFDDRTVMEPPDDTLAPQPSPLQETAVVSAASVEAAHEQSQTSGVEAALLDDESLREVLAQPGVPAARPGDPLAPISPEEFENAPLRPSTPGQVRAAGAARMSLPPGEVEELLDEAEFFVAQGLYAEAMAMLSDAATQHPRNMLVADKLNEVRAHADAARAAPVSVQDDVDHSFELAEKLADDLAASQEESRGLGSDVLDVEQVFAQFKKGVEAQVGLEDTETHFDLGIAYKEMGLTQDAIAEFSLCLSNPQKQCIAHTMIGLCLLEKGKTAEAISHFKKGLYAETKTEREELGLYFELGAAYEQLHDPKEALYYYEKVKRRDNDFRNVNARIATLTRPAAPVSMSSSANDDIDAAFDDLMGDD